MKRFFSFIIRQSVAVVLLVVFVLAFGIFATAKMSVNLLPDINVPMVCVQVIYPGANASSVEKDVTERLEDGLGSISGVTGVDSYSYDNLSAVVLSFDYGTDTTEKKSDIQGKLDAVDLPTGVSTTVYDIDLNAEALATLSVTSDDGLTAEDKLQSAYRAAKGLASSLAAIDGVESVEIKGGADLSYVVSPYKGLELIAPLLVQTFSYGSLDLPLGNLEEDGAEVQIRNASDITSADEIAEMPVIIPAEAVALFTNIRLVVAETGYVPNEANISILMPRIKAAITQYTGMDIAEEAIKFFLLKEFATEVDETTGEISGRFADEAADGTMAVRVGDVATVTTEAAYGSYAYFYGGEVNVVSSGIIVEIYKSNGANSSAVVKEVKKTYAQAAAAEGFNANVTLLDDQSEFISDSISNVLVSMLIGGVLAVIIIFLFLKKVGTSLIIAITMPLSVLAALICLYIMGVTLNMVSLGGLAVGIGMLVDNSIVVIESISKHRDTGKTAFEAAVDGTVEVGGALFGSTLTTVCVFIPIIFSGGLTAEIFTDLSWAVIFSLAFSLIVAVTVIPTLYSLFCGGKRLLKGGKPSAEPLVTQTASEEAADGATAVLSEETADGVKTAQTASEEAADGVKTAQTVSKEASKARDGKKKRCCKLPKIMEKITGFYSKILPKVLSHKLVTILVAAVVFASSVGLLFVTGTEFLPSIDKGQIEIDMSYGSQAQLKDVEADVFSFAETVKDNVENIDYISVSVGKNGLLALTDTGIITVQLTTNRNTDKVVEQINTLSERQNNPSRTVTVKQIDGVVASLMSGGDDMSVTVVGSDNEVLKQIASEIGAKLNEKGFRYVKNSATDTAVEYDLRFDRAKMAQYGIDYQTVVLTLRIGIASYTACTLTLDGEEYDLNVRFADGAVTSLEDLENFVVGASSYDVDSVTSASDVQIIRLSDICEITRTVTEACIRRSNGQNMISVSAALPGTDTGSASKIMQSVAAEVLADYDGYSFESSGISSYLTDAFNGLAAALVVSFFLLYAVMAIQFSSWFKPLIIMASIPFSFTGGFIALVITGTSLNVVSFIGLIMLMGVVVNNAIVMLEKIKQLHDGGTPHFGAVCEACKVRLRPILMTTLTTILALIPMAIGVGQGSELMQPLGIVVIGGLLISTLVTLVLVPAVYCAVHRLSAKAPDGKRQKK